MVSKDLRFVDTTKPTFLLGFGICSSSITNYITAHVRLNQKSNRGQGLRCDFLSTSSQIRNWHSFQMTPYTSGPTSRVTMEMTQKVSWSHCVIRNSPPEALFRGPKTSSRPSARRSRLSFGEEDRDTFPA